MTRNEFQLRFIKSIEECIKYAKRFVYDELLEKYKLNLYMKDKIEIFLRLDLEEATGKLYRDGKIPRWINISVVKVDGEQTIIACDYSGTFTNNDRLIDFPDSPFSPFQISSPPYPNATNEFKDKKFYLVEFNEEMGWFKR